MNSKKNNINYLYAIMAAILVLIGVKIANHTVGPGNLWFDGGYTNTGLFIVLLGGILFGWWLARKAK